MSHALSSAPLAFHTIQTQLESVLSPLSEDKTNTPAETNTNNDNNNNASTSTEATSPATTTTNTNNTSILIRNPLTNEISSTSNIKDLISPKLEDMIARFCFIQQKSKRKATPTNESNSNDTTRKISYRLSADFVIEMPNSLVGSSTDILFEGDDEDVSIPSLILDALKKVLISDFKCIDYSQ